MNWMTSLLFQCNSLDFSNSALACLPSMVTVHDCDGHKKKPNIDLRREGGERGEGRGEREGGEREGGEGGEGGGGEG